jgi:hypothetical protein
MNDCDQRSISSWMSCPSCLITRRYLKHSRRPFPCVLCCYFGGAEGIGKLAFRVWRERNGRDGLDILAMLDEEVKQGVACLRGEPRIICATWEMWRTLIEER